MANKKYQGFGGSAGYPKTRGQDGRKVRGPLGSFKPPKKPPKSGLCVQIAPQVAVPALMLLGNAIVQSFM
jgi:hypothetical protein